MSCDAERRDPELAEVLREHELAEMLAAHCPACAAIERCKHTFGKYWAYKSSGGVGCKCPLTAYAKPAAPEPPPSPAPLPPPVPSGREPWQCKVFATRRREDGVFKPRKRKEKTMRQGTLL